MAPDHPPPWHPISSLPALAAMIDGLHYSAEAVYQRLHRAHDPLRGLDDSTVTRVRDVYRAHVQDLERDAAQLAQWEAAAVTAAQRREIVRLRHQLEQLRRLLTACLALADTLDRRASPKREPPV